MSCFSSGNIFPTRSYIVLEKPFRESNLGQKSILFLGPSIWKKLNIDLKCLSTATSFTHNLKRLSQQNITSTKTIMTIIITKTFIIINIASITVITLWIIIFIIIIFVNFIIIIIIITIIIIVIKDLLLNMIEYEHNCCDTNLVINGHFSVLNPHKSRETVLFKFQS